MILPRASTHLSPALFLSLPRAASISTVYVYVSCVLSINLGPIYKKISDDLSHDCRKFFPVRSTYDSDLYNVLGVLLGIL